MPDPGHEIAQAIRSNFTSRDVNNRKQEPANLVDVLDKLATGIFDFDAKLAGGPNGDPVMALSDALLSIAWALDSIATSISILADAVSKEKG